MKTFDRWCYRFTILIGNLKVITSHSMTQVTHLTPLSPLGQRAFFPHFKHEVFIRWGGQNWLLQKTAMVPGISEAVSMPIWWSWKDEERRRLKLISEWVKTNYWVIRFTFTKLQSAHLHIVCVCLQETAKHENTFVLMLF